MEFMLDESQSNLHPHIHTPSITHTQIVEGGGSGATVFSGDIMGDDKLIRKHGDHKDMRDVVALTEIEHELLKRSNYAPLDAEILRSRIPRFAGVFISPAAFRTRPEELWNSLRRTIVKWQDAQSGDTEAVTIHNGLPRPVSHQDLTGERYRRIKLLEGSDIDVDCRRPSGRNQNIFRGNERRRASVV